MDQKVQRYFLETKNKKDLNPAVCGIYNLKIEVLKQDSADTRKKILKSFIANLMMKNASPQNGVTRINDAGMQRDLTRSFFFLVWKSIFAAAEKTVNGKNAK